LVSQSGSSALPSTGGRAEHIVPRKDENGRVVLTAGEAAQLFRVDPKTVSRWAGQGKLPCFRTLGGHRRFYEDEIKPLVESGSDFYTTR
jgi:excisionase family DNA binding protein